MHLIDESRDAAEAARGRHARDRHPGRLRGTFLLEALIALAVLALGTVAMLGILMGALHDNGSANWRAEAFDLASSTLARMWSEPPDALAATYDAAASGAGYQALLAAALRLPGVTASVNAPAITIDAGADDMRHVEVIVYWQPTGEARPHRVAVAAVLPGRWE